MPNRILPDFSTLKETLLGISQHITKAWSLSASKGVVTKTLQHLPPELILQIIEIGNLTNLDIIALLQVYPISFAHKVTLKKFQLKALGVDYEAQEKKHKGNLLSADEMYLCFQRSQLLEAELSLRKSSSTTYYPHFIPQDTWALKKYPLNLLIYPSLSSPELLTIVLAIGNVNYFNYLINSISFVPDIIRAVFQRACEWEQILQLNNQPSILQAIRLISKPKASSESFFQLSATGYFLLKQAILNDCEIVAKGIIDHYHLEKIEIETLAQLTLCIYFSNQPGKKSAWRHCLTKLCQNLDDDLSRKVIKYLYENIIDLIEKRIPNPASKKSLGYYFLEAFKALNSHGLNRSSISQMPSDTKLRFVEGILCELRGEVVFENLVKQSPMVIDPTYHWRVGFNWKRDQKTDELQLGCAIALGKIDQVIEYIASFDKYDAQFIEKQIIKIARGLASTYLERQRLPNFILLQKNIDETFLKVLRHYYMKLKDYFSLYNREILISYLVSSGCLESLKFILNQEKGNLQRLFSRSHPTLVAEKIFYLEETTFINSLKILTTYFPLKKLRDNGSDLLRKTKAYQLFNVAQYLADVQKLPMKTIVNSLFISLRRRANPDREIYITYLSVLLNLINQAQKENSMESTDINSIRHELRKLINEQGLFEIAEIWLFKNAYPHLRPLMDAFSCQSFIKEMWINLPTREGRIPYSCLEPVYLFIDQYQLIDSTMLEPLLKSYFQWKRDDLVILLVGYIIKVTGQFSENYREIIQSCYGQKGMSWLEAHYRQGLERTEEAAQLFHAIELTL